MASLLSVLSKQGLEVQKINRFDVATVVFEGDVGGLEIQARSLALHAAPDLIGEIFVIENFQRAVAPDWRDGQRALYGPLAEKVRFVSSSDLVENSGELDGWWSQQVAKIEIAKHVSAPAYLLLDAKHHLTKKLDRSFLQDEEGRLRIRAANYFGHPLMPFLQNVIDEFGLPSTTPDRFPTTTPPFPIWTDVALLLSQLGNEKAGSLANYMLAGKLTEFFLYSGFLASKQELQSRYELHDLSYPMIWAGQSSDDRCLELVEIARRGESPFFAVHRKAAAELTKQSRAMVAALWTDAKLFSTAAEAEAALSTMSAKPSIFGRIASRLTSLARL